MRLSTALAALAIVAALAGCGGSTSGETQSGSLIPRSVADRLASQAESIASAAESDECGAAHQADDLRDAADAAIDSGEIPVDYQDELEAAVTNLQDALNCAPAPPEHKGKEEHKGEKKGHDKDEGDTGVTITTDTLSGTTTESGG